LFFGDILLDNGLILGVGHIPPLLLNPFEGFGRDKRILVVDVRGKWVTPGLVDLDLHIGIMSAPGLNSGYQVFCATGTVFKQCLIQSKGSKDGNLHKAPILPWLRSIDGLNMHDTSHELAMAGGMTTMQILLGSANNIGKYILSSSLIWF